MTNGIDQLLDVKNKKAQEATITWDGEGYFNAFIGSARAVSNEFGKLVSGSGIGVSKHHNEIRDILNELLTGETGGNAKRDIDNEVGIDGVELIGLTSKGFSIKIETRPGVYDVINFEGAGVEALIAEAAHSTGVANFQGRGERFSILDLDGPQAVLLGVRDYLDGTNGNHATGENGATLLLEAAIDSDNEYVELVSISADEFTVRVTNNRGAVDTVIYKNAGDVISSLSNSVVDPGGAKNQLVVVEEGQTGVIGIGGSDLKVLDKYDGSDGVSGVLTVEEAYHVAATADERPNVTVVDQGDSLLVSFPGVKGSTDYIVLPDLDDGGAAA